MVSFAWQQRLGRTAAMEPPFLLPAPKAWPAEQRCVACGYVVTLDDAVVPTRCGRCTCLRCFLAWTEAAERLTPYMRHEYEIALWSLESGYDAFFKES